MVVRRSPPRRWATQVKLWTTRWILSQELFAQQLLRRTQLVLLLQTLASPSRPRRAELQIQNQVQMRRRYQISSQRAPVQLMGRALTLLHRSTAIYELRFSARPELAYLAALSAISSPQELLEVSCATCHACIMGSFSAKHMLCACRPSSEAFAPLRAVAPSAGSVSDTARDATAPPISVLFAPAMQFLCRQVSGSEATSRTLRCQKLLASQSRRSMRAVWSSVKTF